MAASRWGFRTPWSSMQSSASATNTGRGKESSLNSASLTTKPLASSVYVHVPETPFPLKRSISVMSLFPSLAEVKRRSRLRPAIQSFGRITASAGSQLWRQLDAGQPHEPLEIALPERLGGSLVARSELVDPAGDRPILLGRHAAPPFCASGGTKNHRVHQNHNSLYEPGRGGESRQRLRRGKFLSRPLQDWQSVPDYPGRGQSDDGRSEQFKRTACSEAVPSE